MERGGWWYGERQRRQVGSTLASEPQATLATCAGRRGLHHKGLGPLHAVRQREALPKAGRLPLSPIPAVPVRVSHVQGARCADRHCQRRARGVKLAAAECGTIGAD